MFAWDKSSYWEFNIEQNHNPACVFQFLTSLSHGSELWTETLCGLSTFIYHKSNRSIYILLEIRDRIGKKHGRISMCNARVAINIPLKIIPWEFWWPSMGWRSNENSLTTLLDMNFRKCPPWFVIKYQIWALRIMR